MRCWEIWCNDVFLGYQYAYDDYNAVLRAVGPRGVASEYGAEISELKAVML
jgi:hypothetical protein